VKKCDVCKGYPVTGWQGDQDDGFIDLCDRCNREYHFGPGNEMQTKIDGQWTRVALVTANGMAWISPHHAPEPRIDESAVNRRVALPPDGRAKKLVAIEPGQPVAGRWRRCTSPDMNCMFRYDLSVPVPDDEHGYVEVIKILVCPLHVNEMVSCPANLREPATAGPSRCPLSEDGDGCYCTVELARGIEHKDADCRPDVDWKSCGKYLAEMVKQKKILVKDD